MLLYMSSDDDGKLFRDSVGPVRPLTVRPLTVKVGRQPVGARPAGAACSVVAHTATRGGNGRGANLHHSAEPSRWVEPFDIISFKQPGVRESQLRKLRQGQYGDSAVLDLHGLTVAQARSALTVFIDQALARGVRHVLVNHGKGAGRAKPALLKSWVNDWLRNTAAVLAFHSARPQHGGSGTTYVLVAKVPGGDNPHSNPRDTPWGDQ